MQENHRSGQDDSGVVEISEPFTITRAALNRHNVSPAVYNLLKQGPANELGVHLSGSLSGPESSENVFEKFQVS